jgi:hypothetical protein
MVLLFFAILALLALVVWLAWIALSYCMNIVREKMDDMSVGKQTKKNMNRAEQVPKKALKFGTGVGRTAKQLLDKFLNSTCDYGRRGREGERRALLREGTYEERVVTGIPRGVFIHGYGYDRERYGDGTNDGWVPRSTSVSMVRREDYDDQCGLSRRLSMYP